MTLIGNWDLIRCQIYANIPIFFVCCSTTNEVLFLVTKASMDGKQLLHYHIFFVMYSNNNCFILEIQHHHIFTSGAV